MAPKIFLTGATGYIGGDVLYALQQQHPDWSYTCLVRTQDKADKVTKAYPNVRIILGDLDNASLLSAEAAKADIVVHTADASDHEGAARAIAEGLSKGHTADHPGYYLHTSGTGILTYADSDADRYGEAGDKIYDDWDNVDELTHLPDHAFHRNVDKVVIEAGINQAASVKTAVVCPPTIYGSGRGPVSARSRQVPELAKCTLKLKKAPIVGAGKTHWNNVHVHDLADFFVLLAEAAASGETADDSQLWGANGYYIIENGEHVWGDLSKLIAKVAAEKGYVEKAETQPMSKDEAFKTADFQALSWGLNSRARAIRARKLLGWTPKSPSLNDEIPPMLDVEYERLQKGIE